MESGNIPKGRPDITKENMHDFLLDTKAVLADSHTMLAGLLVLDDARVKGLLHLRRGWKTYKSALASLEKNSAKEKYNPLVLSSLKFGAGLFHFIISLIPPGLPEKVASLAGFKKGDNYKEIGLDYLREVFHSKSIRSDLAGIVLAVHNLMLTSDLEPAVTKKLALEAEEIYNNGIEKYPKGSVFQALAAVASLEKADTASGLSYTEASIANCSHVTPYPPLLLRLKSQIFLMRFDWKTLLGLLDDIQTKGLEQQSSKKKSNNPWTIVYNNLRLGACHMMLDDPGKAKTFFQTTANAKTSDQWSEQLTFQAKRYLSNGGYFAMFELMVLTEAFEKVIRNANAARLEEILTILDVLANKAPGATTTIKKAMKVSSKGKENDPKIDNRVAYLTMKAGVLRCLSRTDEAKAATQEVLDAYNFGFMKDKMYYALSLMEAGKIHSTSQKDEATKYFASAMKLSGFAWEVTIQRRVRECMQQLGVESIPVAEDKEEEEKLLNSDEFKQMLENEEESSV
eukprot:TRINITY_DN5571_c0_g1_i2.p1 TRINITY_DN5571_c0_g1~~TRINITY_DN5571_c0_g1_i2.p1  ORF type:complete len:512 (-),score=166.74 TRINITY_DN5571_c0_g1_i2:78-1613(-)